MNLKKLLVFVLALSMVVCLCACGNEKTTGETTEAIAGSNDGNVTYTVMLEDENGDPISGAMVLLKLDSSVPSGTNEDGAAIYTVPEADYTVSVISVPQGCALPSDEFEFPEGEYELVITIDTLFG